MRSLTPFSLFSTGLITAVSEHNNHHASLTPYNQQVSPVCHGAFHTLHHKALMPAPQGVCVSPSTRVQQGLLSHHSLWSPKCVILQRIPQSCGKPQSLGARRAEGGCWEEKYSQSTERSVIVHNSCCHITAEPPHISHLSKSRKN